MRVLLESGRVLYEEIRYVGYTNKIEVNFDDPYITWPLWPRDQGEIVAKTFLHYP